MFFRWLQGFSIATVLVLAACTPPMAATPTAAPPPAPAAQQAAAPAAKPGDPLADAITKYYDAAKREGKLVLYGVSGPTLYNPVRDAFMARFPGIALEGVDQRGRESREKVVAEQQSRNYVVDVVISGFDTQSELLANNFIEPYQAAEIPQVIPELVTPGGNFNPRTVEHLHHDRQHQPGPAGPGAQDLAGRPGSEVARQAGYGRPARQRPGRHHHLGRRGAVRARLELQAGRAEAVLRDSGRPHLDLAGARRVRHLPVLEPHQRHRPAQGRRRSSC